MLRPHRLEQSSLICTHGTADSFTSFRSQLKICSQDIVASSLSALLIPDSRFFVRYKFFFVTYLLAHHFLLLRSIVSLGHCILQCFIEISFGNEENFTCTHHGRHFNLTDVWSGKDAMNW